MRLVDCLQLSPEWYDARRGIPTASAFHRIFKAGSKKLSSSADGYVAELLAERGPDYCPPYFTVAAKPVTPAMQRGTDLEPTARLWYESQIQRRTWRPGFCLTDDGRFGCSPDFLVGEEGCGEIKIYDPELHAKWLKAGTVPTQFLAQIHGQLLVTGCAWVDLVLWQPDQPGLIVRTTPNETTRELRVMLEVFHGRYAAALQKVRGADPGPGKADR